MKKTRTKILAGTVLLVAVLFITGIVWSKATRTPVTGHMEATGNIEEVESLWVDSDEILHIRGMPADLFYYDGDLGGTGSGLVNLNMDSLGNGDESGWSTSELTWGSLSGTFDGHYTVTYTNWLGIGHGIYRGTGDFAGMKLMVDFTVYLTIGEPYVANFYGIILDPHGG